jgi:hypothetical protein
MGWSLDQMNVKIFLLNIVIEEEEYVEKPQGRLKKTLYGFK